MESKLEKFVQKIREELEENNFYLARMISHSKSSYRKSYPYNKVLFNGNLCVKLENTYIKVWFGDLDLNFDSKLLKEIANKLDIELYVCYEPLRWEQDLTENIVKRFCVWDTNKKELIPYTKEEINSFKEAEAEEYRLSLIKKRETNRNLLKENKTYEIKDLIKDGSYKERVLIPYDLIEKELEKIRKISKELSEEEFLLECNEGDLYEKYFKEWGYFSYSVLDNYLKKKYDVKEGFIINPSSVWLSRIDNKKLRKIDFIIEKMKNKDYKYTDFGRFVTCNYCVNNLYYLNDDNINEKSYEENYMYIRENPIKKEIKY